MYVEELERDSTTAERLLTRAQAGDPDAFTELTDPLRAELQVHCYRILGSVQDAEDVLQETMMAAWRGIDRFEGRAPLRAWMYKIATNRCLNALRGSRKRGAAAPPGPAADEVPLVRPPAPASDDEPVWLQPYPDHLLGDLADSAPGPEARYEARESVSLAFVAALQHLPPKQRATLVLRDVMGFRTAETADILGCTTDAVSGSLKRARSTIASHVNPDDLGKAPLPGSAREREVLARFTDAWERGDVPALVAMLTDGAWLRMPPLPFGYRGRDAASYFLSAVSFKGGTRRFRLVPTRANGQPAFACYVLDPQANIAHANGLVVLTLDGERIAAVTRFLDNSVLPRFGMPRTLPGYLPRHAR
jgi:RNA polymerase sigma-70 factor (TIGR02960 family)